MTKKGENRRYYLHQKIKTAFRYDPRKRTVFVPWNHPDPYNPHILELGKDFKYNLQTTIE